MRTFDITKPFVELLPARVSYGRGAGYSFDAVTGLLTVTTHRRDRRYRVSPVPGGWRVDKLDTGTDPSETHYHVEAGSFRCDCRGHVRFGYCCHADAVRDLDGVGLVENSDERPESAPITEDEIDDAARRWEELAELCWCGDDGE